MESQVINIDKSIINIKGNWVSNKTLKWVGNAYSDSKLVSISFLNYKSTFEWVKSNVPTDNYHNIVINLFNYDNIGFDIQFSYSIGGGVNRIRTKIKDIEYKPNILLNKLNVGEIKLLTIFEGQPEIKLYVLFIPLEYAKVGRNKLWHIRDQYLDVIDEKYLDILRFGRKGSFQNESSA
jgi:hypothetical protein